MKIPTFLKSSALALLIGAVILGKASAAWTQPTLEQAGYYYYYYLENVYEASITYRIPAATAQAAVAGFGSNVASYAYNNANAANESYSYVYTGYSQYYYYNYLGYLYAYQNYQNPAYAEQLQTFYSNYGNSVYNYYDSIYNYNRDYWDANAGYYYNLIF